MAYFEEIKDIVLKSSRSFYSVSIVSDCIIIEGSYRITCYEKDKIIVNTKKEILEFFGENFSIITSCKNELVIKGKLSDLKVNSCV